MSKRSAEGDPLESILVPPPAAGPAADPFPNDMVLLSYDCIVSPDEFVPTHIASDGSVVLQSETEAVLANLNDGTLHARYTLADAMVHGIAETAEGATAFCVTFGDSLAVISAAGTGVDTTAIAMPAPVCGGSIAVCGNTVVAMNRDAVAVLFPFQSAVAHPWSPPAAIDHFLKCRHGPPVIVLADRSTWRPCFVGPARCEVVPVDVDLWNPLCATDVDFESGICVTANPSGTCTVLLSRAFPYFSDVHIPLTPVRSVWEGKTLFILGDADGTAHSPAVYAITPSIGAVTSTFFPDRIRFHPTESLARLNDLRGRFVLWQGAAYLLLRVD